MSVFEMLCFDLSFSKSGSKITATARSDCKNIDYFPPPAPENRINQIPTLDFHHVENMQQCKDQSRAVPPRAAASPRQLQKKTIKLQLLLLVQLVQTPGIEWAAKYLTNSTSEWLQPCLEFLIFFLKILKI